MVPNRHGHELADARTVGRPEQAEREREARVAALQAMAGVTLPAIDR